MALHSSSVADDFAPYQVHSRREVIALLRAMQERNQLVSMHAGGAEPVVTSVLDVDEEANLVVIDRAPSQTGNQRIIDSDNISFETVLDNIRILFFTGEMKSCIFEDQPALCMAIPPSLIRLQRREHYRVPTPVVNPLRCTIQIPRDSDGGQTTVALPLQNVSGGGIAIIDEKRILDNTIGRTYKDCRIDLPGGSLVVATLEIRNSVDLNLPNGKSIRRIGCLFVQLPRPMLAAVQRYITKLERERNARSTGMQ
jgi:c-di-GMP-binding flagellar brake protein YcgR